MKKFVLYFLFTFLPLMGYAESVYVDGFTFNVIPKGKYAEVTKCPSRENLVIPDKVTYNDIEYPVTKICSNSIESQYSLKAVSLPSTLTTIDKKVFWHCIYLKSVNIPASVTYIGEDAFSEIDHYDVSISDIGSWCNITFVNGASNPLHGADHIYLNGEEIKDIVIPEGVTKINNYAFYKGMRNSFNITIPNSVTSIGEYAFSGFLSSISIPKSVTSFSENAFRGCHLGSLYLSDLETWCNISFPNQESNPLNNVYSLYVNGEKIENLIIPNSVTSINDYAFCGCKSITSLVIPNSVESIGKCTFQDCEELTSVTISNSVTSIGDDAFKNCIGLTALNISDIEAWCNISLSNSYSNPLFFAKHLYLNGKEIKDLVIPKSVTSIEDYAFCRCDGINSVTIPNSLKNIGSVAFSGCTGLTSVHIDDLESWCQISFSHASSNPLYYANHLYLNGEEIKDLVIPNSITSIKNYAFCGCSGLSSINIHKNVNLISYFAFSKCTGLTKVNIPSGLIYIKGHTFSECSSLSSIIIPYSVKSIDYSAFENCINLKNVTIPNSVESIGESAFSGCRNLTSILIPKGVKNVESKAFGKCDLLSDVYCVSENVSKIKNGNSGLYVHPDAFAGSDQEYISLHVQTASIDAYKAIEPWKYFKCIVAWEDISIPGDVTGNLVADDEDIDYVLECIMNNNFDTKADINHDGKVNVIDLVEIVNIIKNIETQ